MSDIYVRDTEKAVQEFGFWFDEIEGVVKDEFKEAYDTMMSEIDGLISEYKDKIVKIEELECELEELKEGK